MILLVSWCNPNHFLLLNPSVTLEVDGVPVPATMRLGEAEFVVPKGTATPAQATLTVAFTPAVTGTAVETLRVVQHFALLPPLVFGGGGPTPTGFTVRPVTFPASITLFGRHPLVSQTSALGLWRVMINTNTVDVTQVTQAIFDTLDGILVRPPPLAQVRLLARTDGKAPLLWVTATPSTCSAFADTAVLCFLAAPQGSSKERDAPEYYADPKAYTGFGIWLGRFLARGQHNDNLLAIFRDHFARVTDPKTNKSSVNFVLPRGFESAVVSSGRHVALVMPRPSNSSHNAAGTVALPSLLSEIHGALVAVGDIAAPAGSAVNGRPLLGIAAHSHGGEALYAAVAASPKAFQEVWLFDTNDATPNLPTLARASSTGVVFGGFDVARVVAPFNAAKGMPSLSARVRRLPSPEPSTSATPADLAASSSILAHALTGLAVVDPNDTANPWKLSASELAAALHQQTVQGNDADGRHYLAKALAASAFP